ncbi:hypothetical protein GLOIN_2v1484840 [Rhizophagus clarus]|uniref:HTH CENPB-type domain-containing protein n=1 Tax=Rhizophagus clarus TaxID=94130 RepID=A0A8H3R3U1_9GLOM|nr:hypothetical protein GLOIN_2v1484840 [Rhizophagus clarus]
MPPQKKRRQNRARQVVAYAKENGIIKAAKSFELDKGMISRWVNSNENFYPEAEKELYDWIIEQRKQGLGITYAIARVKMLDILKKPIMISLYGNSINEFKTSNCWISAFMKRYNLS